MIRLMITFCILQVWALSGIAQTECYTNEQYAVWSEYDIPYGSDIGFAGQVVPLRMNVHRPVGDNNLERPVLVLIHGGGFIEGNKDDLDEVCMGFAARGYTAVTISYRLGMQKSDLWGDALPCAIFNGPVCGYILDGHEPYRAFYRGVQDARGAIRYVKNTIDSVNVDQVFVGGFSAGAFIAIGVGYLDQHEVNTTSAGALNPAPLLAPVVFGDCYPGNASPARPPLGNVLGTQGFNGPHDASVRGVISLAGAAFDPRWIEADDTPLYMVHNTLDGVVPMEYGKIYAPAVSVCAPPCANMNNLYPFVHGPLSIAAHIRDSLSGQLRYKLELIPCIPDCTSNGYCHSLSTELAECLYDDVAAFMGDIICEADPVSFVACEVPGERNLLWEPQNEASTWCVSEPNAYKGIVYRNAIDAFGDPVDLALDLYTPRWLRANERRPLIVFFHGGGFISTTENRSSFTEACMYFASLGYITATVDYRIRWPDVSDEPCENEFQELKKASYRALQDTRHAIEFLVSQHHQYQQIDTNNIVVAGYSAGALLSLLNGFVSDAEMDAYDASLSQELGSLPELRGTIQAVISIAGAIPGIEETMDGIEKPALLIVQGTCDEVTSPGYDVPYFCSNFVEPMGGAYCLAEACETYGIPYHLRLYKGMDHLYFSYPDVQADAMLTARDFLYEHLLCESTEQDSSSFHFSNTSCDVNFGACPEIVQASQVRPQFVLRVFPNPLQSSILYIELPDGVTGFYTLEVLDLQGRRVHYHREEASVALQAIEVELPAGMYLIRLDDGQQVYVGKLMRM